MSFPIISNNIQRHFEKAQDGTPDKTPEICGYYGRACRQMNDLKGACTALCMGCPLAAFAECAAVYEDDHGITRCGHCNKELFCDNCGDMPDFCPSCSKPLDWSKYTLNGGVDSNAFKCVTATKNDHCTATEPIKRGHWVMSIVDDDELMTCNVAGYWCSECGKAVGLDGKNLPKCPYCDTPMEVNITKY